MAKNTYTNMIKKFVYFIVIILLLSSLSLAQGTYIKHKLHPLSGGTVPHSYLNITIDSENMSVNRSENVIITYKINSIRVETITIKIPNELEKASLLAGEKNCNAKWNDDDHRSFIVTFKGSNKISEIKYSAEASRDIPLEDGKFDLVIDQKTISINQGLGEDLIIKPCQIKILNKRPSIRSVVVKRNPAYENESQKFFKNEEFQILFRSLDPEDEYLRYSLSNKHGFIKNGSIKTGDASINCIASESSIFRILLVDDDGDICAQTLKVDTSKDSFEETKRKGKLYSILAILLIFVIFLPIREIFHIIGWPLIIISGIPLFISTLIVSSEIMNYEISIFVFILIYSSYFIEINFEKGDNSNEKQPSLSISYLSTILGLSRDKPDFYLYLCSTFGMTFVMILVILLLPGSDLYQGDPSEKFDFIFSYYSTLTQTFGSILAIVVGFTTWFLEGKRNQTTDRAIPIHMIKNFMILYISLILLSLFGMAIGTVPPMEHALKIVNKPLDRLAIIIFESTLLLIIPAFACLYELSMHTIRNTIHQVHNKTKMPFFPPKP